jgi:vacuolar-type H+-ATPase subunit I/STV1
MTSDPQSSPEETIVLTKADETPVKEFLTQAMIIYGIKDTSPSKILEIVGNQHNTMIKTINTQGQEIIESQKECAKEISDQLVLLREQNKELQEKNQALVKINSDLISYTKGIFAWCFNRIQGKYKNNMFQDIKKNGINPQTEELKNILKSIEQEYIHKSAF